MSCSYRRGFTMNTITGDHFRSSTVRTLTSVLLPLLWDWVAQAETARNASHMVPTGKGWGVEQSNSPFAVVTGNGISYHGGPIIAGTANVYFIWYGNWSNGPKASDSGQTVTLLANLFVSTGGIGVTGYELINSAYW